MSQPVFSLRRATPRAEAAGGVHAFWYCYGRSELSPIDNLNVGGVFLKTSLRKEVGAVVDLHLLVGEGPIRAKAVVRHVDRGRGLGLQFTALADLDRQRFLALLKRLYSAHRVAKPETSAGEEPRASGTNPYA